MRTSSEWGSVPSRYYRFLRVTGHIKASDFHYGLTVLGCADGKFVLPAARKGMKVLAIDIDHTALFGGMKPGVGGDVEIKGLKGRLRAEGLLEGVKIVKADFMELKPELSSRVWISGAIQYSNNIRYTAGEVLEKVLNFVAPRGYLYVDYMLPYEKKYVGRPNCPDENWWRSWKASLCGYRVIYNRVLPPIRDKAHIEYPVDHYHQWGHMFLQRLP